MYDYLISLPLEKAENLLKNNNIKYTIRQINTFKLENYDTCAVVKTTIEDDTAVIYVCNFMCNVNI